MGRILVIGQTSVGRRVCGLLQGSGLQTVHLNEPSDAELRTALTTDVDGIAVMLHDDIKALRYSLAAHHIRPAARLFVAMFDRTARAQLRDAVPGCVVLSPAAISVPAMVAGAIQHRSQALQLLRQVADFFQQTEPHSPVTYLARKAADWGDMPLHEWLAAVIKDGGALAQVNEMLGVRAEQDSNE